MLRRGATPARRRDIIDGPFVIGMVLVGRGPFCVYWEKGAGCIASWSLGEMRDITQVRSDGSLLSGVAWSLYGVELEIVEFTS